jgi:ring-1,2-phenylacetyl-CoA epoxidase subunit PaaB
VKSLDPRVKRLVQIEPVEIAQPKIPLDQFGTYEVFVEPKEGKPFQHEGIVHAPNLEMAYVLAKEAFTRRFTCSSLSVAETRDVFVSPMTEGEKNSYDTIPLVSDESGEKKSFEIYHLTKRGKQHVHVGDVVATSPSNALSIAKTKFNSGKVVYNIWAIQTDKIRHSTQEEKDLWITLPEKKFRDASEYKGGDKLKEFLEKAK